LTSSCRLLLAGLGFVAIVTTVAAAQDQPAVAPDVGIPPPTITTNADGKLAYHFSMMPVVRNMGAATNDLARLKARLEDIDAQLKTGVLRGNTYRADIKTNFVVITGVMTNFVVQNEEGKKLHARIQALETELKAARAELDSKLGEDPVFKAAKSKMESDRKGFKSTADQIEALRKERLTVDGQLYQLRAYLEKAEQEAKEKAERDSKAKKQPGSGGAS
jgi:chromosome segregation ATPase